MCKKWHKFVFICPFNICMHYIFMPPFEKGGHIVLHMSVRRSVRPSVCRSVGMSVSLNLVQLITQEGFSPEASNLLVRKSLMSR